MSNPNKTYASRLVLIFTSALALIIAAITFSTLQLTKAQETGLWKRQLDNLSLVMAEDTSQMLSSAYQILDGIVEEVQDAGVSDAVQLRKKVTTSAVHELLKSRISGVPQIDVATIVADNGDVLNFTRSHPAPKINLADRDYFKAQFNDPVLGVFISTPVKNKGNGKWTFYISRRLKGVGGNFIGIALVGFSVEVLASFYEAVGKNLGDGAVLNLYRRDFTRLIRWPNAEQSIGKKAPDSTAYTSVEVNKKEAEVLYTETPRPREVGGGSDHRLVASRVLKRYPLVVSISVTDRIYLANWYASRIQILSVVAVCILTLLAGGAYLRRVLQQREAEMEINLQLRLKAESANLAKSQFLASMSHELRTPLNAVLGFSQLLALDQTVPAQHREIIQEVENAGKHLLTLVDEVLDLSRIDSGSLELSLQTISTNSILPECFNMLRLRAQQAGVTLVNDAGDACQTVIYVDPLRLRQTILNFMSNAIKYNRPGGQVRVSCVFREGAVRIAVSDTGNGIPLEKQSRLFTPFDRLDADRGPVEGIGLGLVITKRIVEAMGGEIGVESAEGQGSTFWVEFPPYRN